jgi:hypothetical protein
VWEGKGEGEPGEESLEGEGEGVVLARWGSRGRLWSGVVGRKQGGQLQKRVPTGPNLLL